MTGPGSLESIRIWEMQTANVCQHRRSGTENASLGSAARTAASYGRRLLVIEPPAAQCGTKCR